VYIPKDVVGELTAESKIMVMVAGQDGYGVNRIRQVTPEAQQWRLEEVMKKVQHQQS